MSCVRWVSKATDFEPYGQGSGIPRGVDNSPFTTKASLKSYHRGELAFNNVAVGDAVVTGSWI
jgi:hypothetical protein